MFSIFKKKSERERLQEKYKSLLEKAHKLSTVDRTKADQATAEAEEVLKAMEQLPA